MYRIIKSADDKIRLQNDLDRLQQREKDWLMGFNPDKCEVITIRNKRKTISGAYFINQQQLKKTDKAKYLGITIHSKLSWSHHINDTTKKANYTTA